MPPDRSVVVFAGPTLATSEAALRLARRFRVRPPVGRGDVEKLVRGTKEAGVLVIIDGFFYERLSVGHAELREAIALGWDVWGVASMGAIRAREMTALGMRGFGRVFDRFASEDDFQDDEVALLHEPTPPYRPQSEPLVHLRFAVEHLVLEGLLHAEEAAAAIAELKSRWFGERNVRGLMDSLRRQCAASPHRIETITKELSSFDRFRVKTSDAMELLTAQPWRLDVER